MKRIIAFGLLLALVLGVFSGCAGEPEETIATFEPAAESTPGLATVDEFLAAIGPDRTITLAAGTFNLADAADYGRSGGSAWYRWEKMEDGYQLVLTGVDNLTIRGAGMGATILEADPRHANVLVLEKCYKVTLEDLTAGHTQEPGSCAVGVVDLMASMAVTLRRVGLYGCGCVGLTGSNCTDVRLLDSEIYDCTSSGLGLYRCEEVRVQNTKFKNIGHREEGGYAVISLGGCRDTELSGCEITGALTYELVDCFDTSDLILRKCRFTDNRVTSCAFSLSEDVYAVLEDCMFGDNVIRRWYSRDSGWGGGIFYDSLGQEITEADMKKMFSTVSSQEPLPEQTTVEAATVDEFLAAIAPNTRIVLTGKTYDLSTASDYGAGAGAYYYWEEIFDGPELVICGVDNLTIESSDGVLTGHTITAVPRYANVLRFDNCTNLRVAGFTAGHTPEAGYCSGGVLRFDNCDEITVDSCGLFGCGVLGVWAVSCGNLLVKGCDIYECSWGGISLEYVSGASIENCTFRDLEGDDLMILGCSDIFLDGQECTAE